MTSSIANRQWVEFRIRI